MVMAHGYIEVYSIPWLWVATVLTSYNKALASDVCSSASLIHCRQTGNTAKVTWVEKSNTHTADNYRAEILGAVALQILVNTVPAFLLIHVLSPRIRRAS